MWNGVLQLVRNMMLIPGVSGPEFLVCSLWGQLLRKADPGCQEGSETKITRAYSLEEFKFLNTLPFPPNSYLLGS